jgi:hypothetical protein
LLHAGKEIMDRARRAYWHQPSVALPAQETAQLPTLLQADSSRLRPLARQSQDWQPASSSNAALAIRWRTSPLRIRLL